ncbi:tumor necrosis factor receptor superfamily member 16-like isoform X2 [Asterias rubens]|uniref:tumor necrosis factor receptor superfamily member 16-like isoform X2 n=1 Tax=Asterias rubens TaxID=7604 RepID=UPI001454EACF|nr:tumor necrosis factor receptor superfamily member 16-like isoform X2 [Asterias rubens]
MSDTLIRLCLKSVIATTCIPVLLGAPITSLSGIQQPSNPLDIATCGKNSYWDIENAQCKPCVTCPMGMGSSVRECGDGRGEKGICEDCIDGETYQDEISTNGQCKTCKNMCDTNASVLTNCTIYANTECACNEGYGRHPGRPDHCSLCDLFNDDEKPLECQTLTPTPLAPVADTDECLPGYEMDHLNECVDSPGQGWVVPLVILAAILAAVIIVTICICLYRLYVRRQKRPNQQTGSQQNNSKDQVTPGSENVIDVKAPTNGDVKQQSNSHASNHAPDTGDNTTEESTLLGDGTSTVEQTDNSVEEARPDDSLFGNPIPEEPSNGNERPLPLGGIPTRPMADSQKPRVMRKRFLSEGNNPDEAQHSTPSLMPKVRSKCKEAERKSKEEKFEDSFQKACSLGRSIHWEDLERGIRKKCSQMMTPVDRSDNQVSSNDFRTLGEMLKLKPKTDLKECKDLEGVFAFLHSSRSVLVDLEEVLQKLRDIPRMDVVRVLVEEIVKKKPTCSCVS